MRTPVALFIFSRPSVTRRVAETIARAKPPQLLVVADGPRKDRPGEEQLCRETREVIGRIAWECDVHTEYSDINLGCKHRLASGLDWVFSRVTEAIIIEDDCLPEPSFFPFCDELLERYREDERVHMISGTNLLFGKKFGDPSYYFSRFYHIWGWATWARAWKHFDVEMRRWPQLRETDWVERYLPTRPMAQLARYFFDETHAGRVDTWDYQWVLASWLQNALAIVPATNLVSNIGYGVGATHTEYESELLGRLKTSAVKFPLVHPTSVKVLEEADHQEWSLLYADQHKREDLWRRVRSRFNRAMGNLLRSR